MLNVKQSWLTAGLALLIGIIGTFLFSLIGMITTEKVNPWGNSMTITLFMLVPFLFHAVALLPIARRGNKQLKAYWVTYSLVYLVIITLIFMVVYTGGHYSYFYWLVVLPLIWVGFVIYTVVQEVNTQAIQEEERVKILLASKGVTDNNGEVL